MYRNRLSIGCTSGGEHKHHISNGSALISSICRCGVKSMGWLVTLLSRQKGTERIIRQSAAAFHPWSICLQIKVFGARRRNPRVPRVRKSKSHSGRTIMKMYNNTGQTLPEYKFLTYLKRLLLFSQIEIKNYSRWTVTGIVQWWWARRLLDSSIV